MKATEDPRWLALSTSRRDQLLEKHRDINVWDEWWDSTYGSFKERMETIGVDVKRIHFSGFWSQGDGACFDAQISGAGDWAKLLTAFGRPDLAAIVDCSDFPGYQVQSTGVYSHSGTMQSSSYDGLTLGEPNFADPIQLASWRVVTNDGEILNDLDNDILAFLRDKADELYHELEQEHEHLTSDEEVVSYILDHCPEDLKDEDEEESSLVF